MLKSRIALSLILIVGAAGAFAANDVQPGNAAHGKQLYDTKCQGCHIGLAGGDGSVLFTRQDRTVRSLEALVKRVNRCSQRTKAKLSDSDVNDVVKYLNDTYYKFKG